MKAVIDAAVALSGEDSDSGWPRATACPTRGIDDVPANRNSPNSGTLCLDGEISPEDNFEGIIGQNGLMGNLRKQLRVVAPTNSTVLILGETGTGKELVARAIRNLSPRCECPFVKVNCAAIPSGLLESELFGHERGSFTGAIARKMGRFDLANGGTIFLDEIGDIPLELQPKLLRVLQEQEIERLGSTQTLRVNVRVIAATSRNLPQMVADQKFRSDLYYRLNVFPIRLPALREHAEDIPLLVRHFVKMFSARMEKSIDCVSSEAIKQMQQYHWPGNIRELQNVVERAVILSLGTMLRLPLSELKASDSLSQILRVNDPFWPAITLREAEREHILKALAKTNWIVGGINGAASILGLKRTTLVSKMSRLGISRARK
jgi:formate hydrogenlyase transcriptional activator